MRIAFLFQMTTESNAEKAGKGKASQNYIWFLIPVWKDLCAIAYIGFPLLYRADVLYSVSRSF